MCPSPSIRNCRSAFSHGLVGAFRPVVELVGGGSVPLHVGHLDRPVGVAPEESRDGRRILPSLHLAEEESLGRVGDLRQAMGDARGGRPIGRREQDDPDRRRGRLEARVDEPPPVRRERAGAERPMAADDPGDVLRAWPGPAARRRAGCGGSGRRGRRRCPGCGADRTRRSATCRRARGGGRVLAIVAGDLLGLRVARSGAGGGHPPDVAGAAAVGEEVDPAAVGRDTGGRRRHGRRS